jgi:hypothetical protein
MNVRRLLYTLLLALLVLHQDFWNWRELRWVAGLPTGFLYHVAFCLAVALVMGLILRLPGDTEPD